MTSKTSVANSLAAKRFAMTPVAAAVTTALSLTTPVMAQDDNHGQLDEITVTATKRELSLQDVGQSITAFSTSDIEKMGIKSMEDYIVI